MSKDVYGMITADSGNPKYYEQENVIVALHLFDGSFYNKLTEMVSIQLNSDVI